MFSIVVVLRGIRKMLSRQSAKVVEEWSTIRSRERLRLRSRKRDDIRQHAIGVRVRQAVCGILVYHNRLPAMSS